MPNHILNVLKFYDLKPRDVDFIVDTITRPSKKTDTIEYAIDFNKIVPEPQVIEDCPASCLVNKDSHIMEYEDRPWFDWYEWHNKYWGTKWNAYEQHSKIGKSYVILIFQTAWSSPAPIIEQLRLLGYNFNLKYADEDLGSNCGIVDFHPSTAVGLEYTTPTDPYIFAKRLWDRY